MADTDLGQRVKRAILALGYPWFPDQNVVSVEGMDLDGTPNQNRDNAFDDWKGVLDDDGKFIFGPVTATTQPGRYWTEHPMASGGAFIIALGPQTCWTPGDYHGHTVWRQAADSHIMGHRDPNMTYRRNGPAIRHGDIGVHHHGGYNLPRNDISNAAAGCQVIRMTDDQQAFMNLTMRCPRYLADKHGYRLTATVLTAAQVQSSAPAPTPSPAPNVSPDRIVELARSSSLASVNWDGRGRAPMGYVKGMAVAYATVYQMFKSNHPTALAIARPPLANSEMDALRYYGSNAGTSLDILRATFCLLIGLGMRESSGRYCEGRDRSASNTSADTAEAGLFQQSWDSHEASTELPKLLATWTNNPGLEGLASIFREGVSCSTGNLENYGAGDGAAFQRLCKTKPLFAVLCAAVGLRAIRKHWGPINRREAQMRPEATALLRAVEGVVDSGAATKPPVAPPLPVPGPPKPAPNGGKIAGGAAVATGVGILAMTAHAVGAHPYVTYGLAALLVVLLITGAVAFIRKVV